MRILGPKLVNNRLCPVPELWMQKITYIVGDQKVPV